MIIPVIIKLEEDIRERIVYMAHIFIESTINNYRITKEDIDYPTKLYSTRLSFLVSRLLPREEEQGAFHLLCLVHACPKGPADSVSLVHLH